MPRLLKPSKDIIKKLENPEMYIPKYTCYCYGIDYPDNFESFTQEEKMNFVENDRSQTNICPFWDTRDDCGEQNYGYCHYLKKGDFEINEECNNSDNGCWMGRDDNGNLAPLEGTTAELFGEQFPHSLLWDQCKECGINEDYEWMFE